jgi:hypothetical protein
MRRVIEVATVALINLIDLYLLFKILNIFRKECATRYKFTDHALNDVVTIIWPIVTIHVG